MYENSKHANWLLLTLLLTLLISSLLLGWLLNQSSLLANPSLLTRTPLAESSSQTTPLPTIPAATPIQEISLAQDQAESSSTVPTLAASSAPKQNDQPLPLSQLPLTLLDSESFLEQAAFIPPELLPLASLAANEMSNTPKTIAPLALTTQSLGSPASQLLAKPYKSAWLYAGQFQNGKWTVLGLDLDATSLPEPNRSYQLTWGAKIRSAPPSPRLNNKGDNLAESIGYLAEGSRIQVLSVKQSGKNGHIWLEIAYGQ